MRASAERAVYRFRSKPQDPGHPHRWVAPHQPRLDWQMWFAALGEWRDPWFRLFLKRLLEGSPPVLDLMGTNPFPDRPPRYVRVVAWDWKAEDGKWTRERLGPVMPVVTLGLDGGLEAAP